MPWPSTAATGAGTIVQVDDVYWGERHGGGTRRLKRLPGRARRKCLHSPCHRRGPPPSEGYLIFWWVNALLESVKSALHGTYSALGPKYLQRFYPIASIAASIWTRLSRA